MVHYRYWIGILIACLGVVTATAWFKNSELVTLINFAATISSLILAILAIIITTNSNSDLFSALGSLGDSASRVAQSADQLERAKSQLLDHVSGIPEALGQMGERIDRVQETWTVANSKGVSDAVKLTSNSETRKNIEYVTDIDKILKSAPAGGLIAAYILSLSAEKAEKFNPDDIQPKEFSYFTQGYIHALLNVCLVSGHVKDKIFSISSPGPFASEMLKAVMDIETRAENPYVKGQRKLVEQHFNSAS